MSKDKVDKNTEKQHKEQYKHLEPYAFKKGESGNPLGRPKKELSMTNAMKDILNEIDPETKIERYKKLLLVAIDKAEKGDNDMIKYLVNRIDGMPKGSDTNIQVNNFIPLLGGDSHKEYIEGEDDNTR
jgi:hypothetical protein